MVLLTQTHRRIKSGSKGTILVVDDEEDIVELVRLNLEREGYGVLVAGTGEDAVELAKAKQPQLIVLDLMLPGMGGLDVCRIIRHHDKTAGIPIVMLSAKSQDCDIVSGLELGADDYMTKPFSSKVLVARIRRLLKRRIEESLDRNVVHIHDLTIDPARCEASIKDQSLCLTLSEFNILYTLARRPGIVFTRYQIVDALHGSDYIVSDRAVDVQIAYLRKKLGASKDYIETIRGVGYRFKEGQ
ncbi:MAG: response regulator transcription factor [Phycisphaeraceae bacterium]|nr:response regulator transcription factor [Phycisphaeraceae bacterium]